MSWRSIFIVLFVFLGADCLQGSGSEWKASTWLDRADPIFGQWNGLHRVQAKAGKKSCSEVYPMPEAAKHWTDCKEGNFSRCGGPPECSCSDADDKLVWYHCKEGDYARCQDDELCKDSDSD
jgi:hypothetical protein